MPIVPMISVHYKINKLSRHILVLLCLLLGAQSNLCIPFKYTRGTCVTSVVHSVVANEQHVRHLTSVKGFKLLRILFTFILFQFCYLNHFSFIS